MLLCLQPWEYLECSLLGPCSWLVEVCGKIIENRVRSSIQAHTYYVYTQNYTQCARATCHIFNRTVKRDIPCQHLIPFLLHLPPEWQIQSLECEEKFTQSFRLVNTLKLGEKATRAQDDCKLDLKGFRGEREERRGECMTHVWPVSDDAW